MKIINFHHVTVAAPKGAHETATWFYEKILGLKRLSPPSILSAAYDVWWFAIGDKILHIDFDPPFVKVAHNRHIAIEVENLEEAREHFHKYDIETRGDVDVPNYDRFHIDDPFGNGIEILCRKKKIVQSKYHLEAIKAVGKLRVGIATDLPGMGYLNPNTGRMEGCESDLARLLARKLLDDENKIEFVKVLPAERLTFIKEGRVEIVIAQLTITPERCKEIDFSYPYYVAKEALLVLKGSPIKRLEDLKGKKVAVADGTITYQHFKMYCPEAQLVVTKAESDGIQALKNKQVDAMGNDNVNLWLLQASMDDPNQFEFVDIGDDFPQKPFGIGVKKGSTALLHFINDCLEECSSSGELQKILELKPRP